MCCVRQSPCVSLAGIRPSGPSRARFPAPSFLRLLAFEETLARSGPEDRPPRYDVEIGIPLPEDFDDLRLGRLAHVEQRDRVAFILVLGGEGRHQYPGSDPARPGEDLVPGDLDDAFVLGLQVEHGGLGGQGVAVDQQFAPIRGPEGSPEVAHAMPPRAVGAHHQHAASGPRLVARMEQEGDPLVVRRKGRVIAIAEIRCKSVARRGPRSPTIAREANRLPGRPRRESGAVMRPLGHTTAVETRCRFVGDEGHPSLDKIHHVDLRPVWRMATETAVGWRFERCRRAA